MTDCAAPAHLDHFGFGETVASGLAVGIPLLLAEPLSFWGGYDSSTGLVVDTRHPQHGCALGGRVVLMASAKGSSSSSSVLAEAVRRGTAPAALVMRRPDLIIALASMVAYELYAIKLPIVVVDASVWEALGRTCDPVKIDADAGGVCTLTLESAQ